MLEIQNSGTLYFNNNDKAPEEKKSQICFLPQKVIFVAVPCKMLSPQ